MGRRMILEERAGARSVVYHEVSSIGWRRIGEFGETPNSTRETRVLTQNQLHRPGCDTSDSLRFTDVMQRTANPKPSIAQRVFR